MSDSIFIYISAVIGGGGAFFILIFTFFYGMWKPYFRKEKLSQAEFARACKLIGISTIIMVLSIFIPELASIFQDPQPDNVVQGIFGGLLCLAGFPALTVGMFVFIMKTNRFVKPPDK